MGANYTRGKTMITHNLIQGSPEWAQFRFDHFGASEAVAMLGLSPKVKRNELLHMKHTGTVKEFSDWVQENILDYGHEVEDLARPIIEERIGEELYPVTCSDGLYGASCDGLTLSEEIAFEHKQWNETLAASVTKGILPEEHIPQCQQTLMVTGAQKVIFVVSDGTADKMASMEVFPDVAWFERIRAGWEQFQKDLAVYEPRDLPEKPQADAILRLPALVVQIRGEVVTSNLTQFQEAAKTFIANIKTDLKTDEDFANAEATIKFCEKAEKDLELAKRAALSQTASIDELLRTLDYIMDDLRTNRLVLNKAVTNEKTRIKENIIVAARAAFMAHIEGLEAEIKPLKMPSSMPDFIAAAKGRRTMATLHDAVDTELARAKIVTNATAKDIRAKLAWCKEHAEGYGFLFSDLQLIIQKPIDDFQLIVNTRINDHKKAEADKVEAALERIEREKEAERVRLEQEAERARLRAEEEAKLAKVAPEPKAEEVRWVPVVEEKKPVAAVLQTVPIEVIPEEPSANTTTDRDRTLQDARCFDAEEALRQILLICESFTEEESPSEAMAQIALIAEANLRTTWIPREVYAGTTRSPTKARR